MRGVALGGGGGISIIDIYRHVIIKIIRTIYINSIGLRDNPIYLY